MAKNLNLLIILIVITLSTVLLEWVLRTMTMGVFNQNS